MDLQILRMRLWFLGFNACAFDLQLAVSDLFSSCPFGICFLIVIERWVDVARSKSLGEVAESVGEVHSAF